MRRISGLDTIRLFCALTVLFYHNTSPPILALLSDESKWGSLLKALYAPTFNGQAAVIAFFVVSGFCIHYPFASGRAFAARPFLISRAVRILVPTLAYLALLQVFPYTDPVHTILLWSVWCELAYYGLYPLLRHLFERLSVARTLALSYIPAAAVTVSVLMEKEWQGLFAAHRMTWIVGLPCWLIGCLLAERIATDRDAPDVSPRTVWLWRLGAAACGYASYFAMFHFKVSFLISLQLFAAYCFFWLRAELRFHRNRSANPTLERLGGLTFSLYLMHLVGKHLWERLVPGRDNLLLWALEVAAILAIAALFYVLVELPSHKIARRLSKSEK